MTCSDGGDGGTVEPRGLSSNGEHTVEACNLTQPLNPHNTLRTLPRTSLHAAILPRQAPQRFSQLTPSMSLLSVPLKKIHVTKLILPCYEINKIPIFSS